MSKIVSLGSALQDILLLDRDDLVPTKIGESAIFGRLLLGAKLDIDRLEYAVGGGGVNSAITFARTGHEAVLISNISQDSAGAAILKTLAKEGIDSSFMQVVKNKTTGTSLILLDPKSRERTILTCRGASEKFDNFDENSLEKIQPDWLYVTTLRGDMDTLKRFFTKAKSLGAKIMFNPGRRELRHNAELLDLLQFVDILNVNRSEATEIVPGIGVRELLFALNSYVETVIITDGPAGGVASNSSEAYHFGIYEEVKVKDVTGAGDAFGSGFLASLAGGKKFRQALVFAAANSTAVVGRLGANRGILSLGADLHSMPIEKI